MKISLFDDTPEETPYFVNIYVGFLVFVLNSSNHFACL